MRIIELRVVISEGRDHFWDDIIQRNVSGIEEVLEAVKIALENEGFDVTRVTGEQGHVGHVGNVTVDCTKWSNE